uniref:RRM domain-containing protein n=1 Tax=Mustela putorius furo TaxID=9669 RepID=M3Z199_MUSPF
QPTQGYAQTTQAYGQQSYGTCGQPTDVSFTQAQITATYGQTTYATSYGPPPRYTTPAASQAYSLHCMALVFMIPTAIVTTIQAFCAPQSAYGTQPAYPVYRQQPTATEPVKPQDGNNLLRLVNLSLAPEVTMSPDYYGQNNYSYPRYLGATPCSQSAPPSSPTSYSSAQLARYDQNSYSRQNTYGQPTSCGQQSSYGQQSRYGQQLSTSYPPNLILKPDSPSQYSQQSSSYRQQSSFQQDHPSSMGVYGVPGVWRTFQTGENGTTGALKEGYLISGSMSRNGQGGRCRAMGAGEQGGFMVKGPDLDLGPPVALDEDSGNVQFKLNDNAILGDLADFIKQCEVVKINKRTRQPMIHIYLDKETGKPKGGATVSYEDAPAVKVAMEWFDGKDFQGSKLKVSLAKKQPPMNSIPGSMLPREGRRMPKSRCGGPDGPRGPGGPMGHMRDRGGDRSSFPPRGSQSFQGNPSGGGNIQHRAGDWQCPNPGYGNQNFAWRTENHSKVLEPEGFLPPPLPPLRGDCGRGSPGGRQGGRSGLMSYGGQGGMFRNGHGGERGGFGCGMDRGDIGEGRWGNSNGSPGPLMEQMGRR